MTQKKQNFFKKKSVIRASGIIALITGIYFLGTNLTGNIIKENVTTFSTLFVLGILLLACSAILITYSIRKK